MSVICRFSETADADDALFWDLSSSLLEEADDENNNRPFSIEPGWMQGEGVGEEKEEPDRKALILAFLLMGFHEYALLVALLV